MLKEQLLLLIRAPLYAIVIAAEIILSNLHLKRYYTLKDTLMNVYLCIINSAIDLLFRAVYLVILANLLPFQFASFSFNPYIYWISLFILEDLAFYFEHRVDHYCRLFWAVHVTHHSSEEYNLTTGFRSSVFMPFYRYLYFVPLAIIGFRPIDILFMYAVTQTYGILVHTQAIRKLPRWIEYIFVTPSHHRVHHASNVPYLDKNMGMVLIIWDRLFGTFIPELPEEPPVYGLTKPLDKPHHPFHIIFHEWREIAKVLRQRDISFGNKLRYLIKAPGWSHDGSTRTAKALQAEWKKENDLASPPISPRPAS